MTTTQAKARPTADSALSARASRAYADQGKQAQQEQWILQHLPLVRHIVNRVASQVQRREDIEDLVSAGTLGLVRAARAYDPTKEAEFKTYAYIRIRGAVIDELRARTFVPSAVHQQIRRVEAVYEQFAVEHGRTPDDEELARALGVPVGGLYRVLEEARRQQFLSIHGLGGEEPGRSALSLPDRGPAPEDHAQRKEQAEKLAAAIAELPKRDRTMLLLYYERDLTMREAAKVLGVTESRISQMHASAVFKLSMKLRSLT